MCISKKMICLNYHEIFILVTALTYINYLIWTLFLLFSGECFQKMICFFGLFSLPSKYMYIHNSQILHIYSTCFIGILFFIHTLFGNFFFSQVQSPGLWSSFVCWSLGFIAIVITEILACKKNDLFFNVHIHHIL